MLFNMGIKRSYTLNLSHLADLRILYLNERKTENSCTFKYIHLV